MGKSKIPHTTEAIARGLVAPRYKSQGSQGADWRSVDAAVIHGLVVAAADAGGAVRFGFTRNGGAYAIGVYGFGDGFTEYLRPSDDITGYLRDLTAAYIACLGGVGGSTATDSAKTS